MSYDLAIPLRPPARLSEPPVSVAIVSRDRLGEELLIRGLRTVESVRALPGSETAQADVVLVLAREVDEQAMADMARIAEQRNGFPVPMVLVCQQIGEHQLLEAIDHGLAAVTFWSEATVADVVRVIVGTRQGSAEMPQALLGPMLRKMRSMRSKNAPSRQVSDREVDIIRYLAEGLSTAEIAVRTNFSERTVKNIIANLTVRFKLNNRAHLVAFSFRHEIL